MLMTLFVNGSSEGPSLFCPDLLPLGSASSFQLFFFFYFQPSFPIFNQCRKAALSFDLCFSLCSECCSVRAYGFRTEHWKRSQIAILNSANWLEAEVEDERLVFVSLSLGNNERRERATVAFFNELEVVSRTRATAEYTLASH